MEFLAKVQESKYIEDMYENEYLFFSRLSKFNKPNDHDKAGRFDPMEGQITQQITYLAVEIDGKRFELSDDSIRFAGSLTEKYELSQINVCSLIKIQFDSSFKLLPIDSHAIELGDKALLIPDHELLFSVLDFQLTNMGYEFSRGSVIYHNSDVSGDDFTLHHKHRAYSFQQEYRILIGPEDSDMSIPIPGLKSHSLVLESRQLEHIKIVKQ